MYLSFVILFYYLKCQKSLKNIIFAIYFFVQKSLKIIMKNSHILSFWLVHYKLQKIDYCDYCDIACEKLLKLIWYNCKKLIIVIIVILLVKISYIL